MVADASTPALVATAAEMNSCLLDIDIDIVRGSFLTALGAKACTAGMAARSTSDFFDKFMVGWFANTVRKKLCVHVKVCNEKESFSENSRRKGRGCVARLILSVSSCVFEYRVMTSYFEISTCSFNGALTMSVGDNQPTQI